MTQATLDFTTPGSRAKPPTKRDLAIYADMRAGKVINSMQMYQDYNTTSHRDIAYRLRCAGYPVKSEMVRYKTAEGVRKCYARYWVEQTGAVKQVA